MRLILRRAAAFYVDMAICYIIYTLFFKVVTFDYIEVMNTTNFKLYFFTINFSYFFLLEYFFGITLGKMIFRLRIRFSENKIKSIIFRFIGKLIPFDMISFLFNHEKKMWHDIISKSEVTRSSR